MSMPTALVVMAVVLIVVGAGAYAAFGTQKPQTSTSQTCEPLSSPECTALTANHDVTLISPFAAAQTAQTIPFSVILPSGASSNNITFNFGDGSGPQTYTTTSATHAYADPGTYLVSVQATIKGAIHDNYAHLTLLTISASSASGASANVPSVAGSITANSSQWAGAPTAIIQPGGSVTFSGSYTASPTNPLFVTQAPTITASGSGVTVATPTITPTTASAVVSFSDSGVYAVNFVGTSVDSSVSPAVTANQTYTWTVFVAPSGVHASAGASTPSSPHPGSLNIYELAPGGSKSHDPSVEYDSVSGEVVTNLYQTLIQYNGTAAGPDPSDFVPDAAVCVPGSPQCSALFPDAPATAGTALVNTTTGAYTFVLSANSQFYDPKTNAHWGVYPTDVMFSLIRTEAFSELPFFGANNGWLISQALLSAGNASWDSGYHGSFNNTPANSFGSILVNASAYCPASAMSNPSYHGCVTLLADANGLNWPFFLELVADPTGTGIEPCGWFSASAQGAGIPDWTTKEYAAGSGDRSCLLPGDATSTDSSAFTTAVSAMGATDWDSWQVAGSASPYVGNVQFNSVGSGPYYMQNLVIGASYKLAANPYYTPNPDCTWTGCMPAVNAYAHNVTVTWEPSALEGEQAYEAGTSDSSGIPTTDTSILLQLLQQGKAKAVEAPTISIYFWPFNLAFDVSAAAKYTTNPITVPSDFFSHTAMREFFAHAFPYNTVQSTINTVDGITYDFAFGGAIPKFMGNYYPTNVSWPSGDPSTDSAVQGTAAWWWAQATTPGTPYYDSELTACTTSNPCQIPWFGETGAPNVDEMAALLQSEVSALSGGRLKVNTLDINFANLVANIETPAYSNPMPMYQLGWAPDYPDPTDYTAPLYGADGPYTSPNAVAQQLEGVAQFNASSYSGGTCPAATDYAGYAQMAIAMGGIPDACQGHAYAALNFVLGEAAIMPSGAARALLYNYAEQIANGLALYIYWGQTNLVVTTAPWINPATPNTSVMFGGGNEQTWWTWGGTDVD